MVFYQLFNKENLPCKQNSLWIVGLSDEPKLHTIGTKKDTISRLDNIKFGLGILLLEASRLSKTETLNDNNIYNLTFAPNLNTPLSVGKWLDIYWLCVVV